MGTALVDGPLGVLAAVVLIAVYCAVCGAAVRVGVSRWITFPQGLGLTLGFGATAAMVVVSLSFVLFNEVVAAVYAVLIASALFLIAQAVRAPRRRGHREPLRVLAPFVPTWTDGLAALASVAVLVRLLKSGMSFWDRSLADYPSYAASVEIWLAKSGAGKFLTQHTDPFADYQVDRALAAKPALTAFLSSAQEVTGRPAHELLTPVTYVLLFLALAVLCALAAAVTRGGWVARCAALVPALSVVPMARVFDGQLGRLALVGLIAVALTVVAQVPQATTRPHVAVLTVLLGAVFTAVLWSNSTLAVGIAPFVLAMVAWVACKRGAAGRPAALIVAGSAVLTLILTVPFVSWIDEMLNLEGSGSQGQPLPLPSPLALVGLQRMLRGVPSTGVLLVQWGVLLVIVSAGYVLYKVRHGGGWTSGVPLLVLVGNVVSVAALRGIENYTVGKLTATALSTAVPLLLAAAAATLVRSLPRRLSFAGAGAVALLMPVGVAITMLNSRDVPVRISAADLDALGSEASFAGVNALNVDLGNIYENEVVALAVPVSRVAVTGGTYAVGALPMGDKAIVRKEAVRPDQSVTALPVGASYALVDLGLDTGADTFRFNKTHAADGRYLFGAWSAPDANGTWSTGERAQIVLDLDPSLRGKDVRVSLTGRRFATAEQPRSASVAVNGQPLATAEFAAPSVQTLDAVVPAEATNGADGRIVLELSTPEPLSPADFGGRDGRKLGYYLVALSVRADT